MNNTVGNELNNIKNKYKAVSRRKWMFRLATFVFVVFSFMYAVAVSIAKDATIDKAVKKYTSSTDINILMSLYDDPKIRGNRESLTWYEQNVLGIDNNTALAGIPRTIDYDEEQKNKIKDIEAYIDKNDGKLKIYKNQNLIFDCKDEVLEVIATDNQVFYINQSDSNSLHVYNIEGNQDSKIIDDKVVQFAIYGNRIIYLNRDNELFRYSLETNDNSKIAQNVQRFFLSGSIIAQTEKSIVEIKIDGKKYEKIIDDALLVGANEDCIYFSNFGVTSDELQREIAEGDKKNEETRTVEIDDSELSKEFIVYKLDMKTKEKIPVAGSDKLVRAVYVNGEDILIDTVD